MKIILSGLAHGRNSKPVTANVGRPNPVAVLPVRPIRAVKRKLALKHTVLFYYKDSFLVDSVSRFLGDALRAGQPAVLFATEAHRQSVAERLKTEGLDIVAFARQGRYGAMDAVETLKQFMVGGLPDRARFANVVDDVVARAKGSAPNNERIAIFGEMVALLWQQGNADAVIELEKLWNEIAAPRSISLCCGHKMDSFPKEEDGEHLLRISDEHSVVYSEDADTMTDDANSPLKSIAYLQQRIRALENEVELRHSEERFRILVEAVQDYAVYMLDPAGIVTTWNSGAERIKGYTDEEIIGRNFSCFFPEEDIRAGKPQQELEIAAKEGHFESETWRIRKDGSRFWASVVIAPFHDDNGKLIGYAKVTRDFTERMLAQEELKRAQQRTAESEAALRELSLRILRAQDEERRRIGRELHDSIGQYLSVLKMKMDSLRASDEKPTPAETSAELEQCIDLAEQSIKEVRTISYLLYPPMLEEMGLPSATSWYLDGFAKRSGIKTTLRISPNFSRLSPELEMALFRVLQESLTNVHRHSESATADVQLLTQDGSITLIVSDTGKGIPDKVLEQLNQGWLSAVGVGFRGMNERMRQLGGSLELSSSKNGTIVIATLPVAVANPPVGGPAE